MDMENKFKGLKQAEAKLILRSFFIFNIFSLLVFSTAAFNVGASKGHISPLWVEGALMIFSALGFLISLFYFSRIHRELLKISKISKTDLN